ILENIPQQFVVEIKLEREFVGRFMPVFLGAEMEQAGVVAVVGLFKEFAKARINFVAVGQRAQPSIILNAAPFADTQKDDAVNDALNGEVEFALGKLFVSQGKILREFLAPRFDGFKKGVVNVGSAALGFAGFRKLVERAFEDSLAGKHTRSEEHTSELQSRQYLVCRLLLEN